MQEEGADPNLCYRPLSYLKLSTPDFFDQKMRRLRTNDKNPTQIFQDLAKVDFKLLNQQNYPFSRERQRIFDTFLYQFKDQSIDFQKALKKDKMYHFTNVSQLIKQIEDLPYKKQLPSNDFHLDNTLQQSQILGQQMSQISIEAWQKTEADYVQEEFNRQNLAFLVAFCNIFEGDYQNVIFPFLQNQAVLSQDIPNSHPFVSMFETLKINQLSQDKKDTFTIPKITFLNLDGTDSFSNWSYFMTQNNVQLISIIDEKQTINKYSRRTWINQTIRDMDFDSEYDLLIPLRLKDPKQLNTQLNNDNTLTLGDQEMYFIFKKIQAQIQLFNPKLLVISYAFKYHYDSDIYIDPNILGEFVNRFSENCTRIIFLPRYDNYVPYNLNNNRDWPDAQKQTYTGKEIIYMIDCLKAVAIGMNRSLLTEKAVAFFECETGKQLSYYKFRKSFNQEMTKIRRELAIKAGKPSPDLMDQFDTTTLMIEKFEKQLNYRNTTNLRSFIEVPRIKIILQNKDADTKVDLKIVNKAEAKQYYFDEQKSFLQVFQYQDYILNVYIFQACTLLEDSRQYLNLFFRIDFSRGTKSIDQIYEFNFPTTVSTSVQEIKSVCQLQDRVILMAQSLSETFILIYPSIIGQGIIENLQNPFIYTHVKPLSKDYERLLNWTCFSMIQVSTQEKITQLFCIGGRATEKKIQISEAPIPIIKLPNQIFHIDIFDSDKKFKVTVIDEKQMLPSSMIPTLFPLVFKIKIDDKACYYLVFGGEQISFDAQQDLKMDSYYIFKWETVKGSQQIKNVKIMECQSKYSKGINFYGMTSRNTIIFDESTRMSRQNNAFTKLKLLVNSSLRTLKICKKLKQRPPKIKQQTDQQQMDQQEQIQNSSPAYIYINSELPIMAKQYINFRIDHLRLQQMADNKAKIDNWSLSQHQPIIFADKNVQLSSAGFADSFLRDNQWYSNDDAPRQHCWTNQVIS